MNNLYTKSSAIAKVTDEDIKIFSKVCEKGINDFTDKNTEFTDNFELAEELQASHNLKKARVLKDLEINQFAKVAISDRFLLAVEIVKNKVFLKCYQGDTLILEINMSKAQLESIEDKYYYDLEKFTDCVPRVKYQIFYAGSFMRKNPDSPLSSKLIDLRLLKIVDLRDVH